MPPSIHDTVQEVYERSDDGTRVLQAILARGRGSDLLEYKLNHRAN
jgi:hypothetical protein